MSHQLKSRGLREERREFRSFATIEIPNMSVAFQQVPDATAGAATRSSTLALLEHPASIMRWCSSPPNPALCAVPDEGPRQASTSLVFGLIDTSPAPFAWIGRCRQSRPKTLPFAKVGNSIWSTPASADDLMKQLLSGEPDEPQGPKRGHTDEWYQQRCVFCAHCKSSVNSHYQKRGSRCQGCRRWFHAACLPTALTAAATDSKSGGTDQSGSSSGRDDASSHTQVGSGSVVVKQRRTLFFHDPDCEQVYTKLAAVAAAGYQPFTLPDQRPFWQRLWQPPQDQQDQAWRLLDLSEVRSLYKDAQKREILFKQHKKAKQLLESAAAAAAEREEAARQSKRFSFLPGSSSSSAASGQGAAVSGSLSVSGPVKRHLQSGSLSEFLLVGEVLKPLGETPRDLLEDSYAIITRDSSAAPAAVATFNVYGSDHARLQGVATPVYLQRKGHATRLVQQLELLLAGAGVQDLVVIIEPEDDTPKKQQPNQQLSSDTAQLWFKRRLGFKPASSEQQMIWRRELPEYHKGLVGRCGLLIKPLDKAAAAVVSSKRA